MQIQKLTLTNVRAFEHAEFEFQPGMNLLVGVNGAGKSTVLDALTSVLSYALKQFTPSISGPRPLGRDDVKIGEEQLQILSTIFTLDIPIDCELEITKEPKSPKFTIKPNNSILFTEAKSHNEQPFAVLYSTKRSQSNKRMSSQHLSRGGFQSVFADALSPRELNIKEFTQWLLAQEALNKENGSNAIFQLADMTKLIEGFLGTHTNLQLAQYDDVELVLNKPDGTKINIQSMSDGERSILAVIFDLAKRLTFANPELENPIQDGKAVVLIDELDLHLHPSWQRTIVDRLTSTFPNCQFICTTHSPQIIGEVSPEQITLIMDGQILRPSQSLGMDTNWILRNLMGVDERDTDTLARLEEIETLIEDEEYDQAETKIEALRSELGDFPELVGLQTQIDMIDFWADELLQQAEDAE